MVRCVQLRGLCWWSGRWTGIFSLIEILELSEINRWAGWQRQERQVGEKKFWVNWKLRGVESILWMDTETQRVQLILGNESGDSGILVLSRRGARLSASLIPMQWPIAHT